MSERERVARLREWLDSIVPLQGQMAEEEDTVEAIDLWLDLKWLRENLLALLAERQGEIGYIVITHKLDSRGEEKEAEVHLRADAEEKVLALPLGVHPLYLAPQPSVEREGEKIRQLLQVNGKACTVEVDGYGNAEYQNFVAMAGPFPEDTPVVVLGPEQIDAILAALEADHE